MPDALSGISTRYTSQTEPIPGRTDQVRNNAGGYVFGVSPEQRILRFLVLGVDGGTYYVAEHKLAQDNATFLIEAFKENPDYVDLLMDVSLSNRAPRQNPTLFALAVAAASTNLDTRKKAYQAIPRICRTSTMLFIFVGYTKQFRGWSAGLRRAIADWYDLKTIDQAAYQVVKYRQREGWTHRDLFRLSHVKGFDQALGNFILGKDYEVSALPRLVQGYLEAQTLSDPLALARVIREYNLPWEAVPSDALSSEEIWEAMIPTMGLTALVRNLGRFSKLGMTKPFSATTKVIIDKLSGADLRASRVHPFTLLNALMTYKSGHGFRGGMKWTPSPQVVDALNHAFYESFPNVVPAGKNTLVALDVSGSMGGLILNSAMTCRDASAALAMLTMRTEPEVAVVGFTAGDRAGVWNGGNGITTLPFSKTSRLDDAIKAVSGLNFGSTDCSLPMQMAQQEKLDVDTFQVITDSETWAGRTMHPNQALESYRQASGRNAKLVVVGMTSTNFSIADPKDPGMMDVVGFDSSTPELMASFSRGDF
jgi:60 kDa SS-A/Ro ribonucleoprotein